MRTPEPVVLSSGGVRLEPLSDTHVDDLVVAGADPSVWSWLSLGAAYDGTLRHHRLRPDGSVRDSAYFSVLACEWPAVRDGLLARLGA